MSVCFCLRTQLSNRDLGAIHTELTILSLSALISLIEFDRTSSNRTITTWLHISRDRGFANDNKVLCSVKKLIMFPIFPIVCRSVTNKIEASFCIRTGHFHQFTSEHNLYSTRNYHISQKIGRMSCLRLCKRWLSKRYVESALIRWQVFVSSQWNIGLSSCSLC